MAARNTSHAGTCRYVRRLLPAAVVVTVACADVAATASPAHESAWLAADLSAVPLAKLEEAFWACDYMATTYGAGVDHGICSAVFFTLEMRKFDGSFEALVSWWRTNKSAEFAKLRAMHHRE